MKSVMLVCLSLLCISVTHAKVCMLTQPTAVKQTINGNTVGQLRATTPVKATGYDADAQGNIWVYVNWQGQPLASVKRPDLQNQGWVLRDHVKCSD